MPTLKEITSILILTFCFLQNIHSYEGENFNPSPYHLNPSFKPNPSIYLDDSIWNEVQGYLIPDDHPAKDKLDQIFSKYRLTASLLSLQLSNSKFLQLKREDKIIVFKHPDLPGYVIKTYLDGIPKMHPECYCLMRRIDGCRLVHQSIQNHGFENIFKAPEKWLYLLPDEPSPQRNKHRKMFILVEDEMDVLNEKNNEAAWKNNEKVTETLLNALYIVMHEAGLADLKPKNCPFCHDGKIAFIDTGSCKRIPLWKKFKPYLSRAMWSHWSTINIQPYHKETAFEACPPSS